MSITTTKKVHEGRNIKRFREMLGITRTIDLPTGAGLVPNIGICSSGSCVMAYLCRE